MSVQAARCTSAETLLPLLLGLGAARLPVAKHLVESRNVAPYTVAQVRVPRLGGGG